MAWYDINMVWYCMGKQRVRESKDASDGEGEGKGEAKGEAKAKGEGVP